MSLGGVFKRFFGESDESKREREEDEVIKSLSLAACENKHKILLECYKTSWVGGCQLEMDNFWKCVNDHKVILKEKAKDYRKNILYQDLEQNETPAEKES